MADLERAASYGYHLQQEYYHQPHSMAQGAVKSWVFR
jgi:hypothetical protein